MALMHDVKAIYVLPNKGYVNKIRHCGRLFVYDT